MTSSEVTELLALYHVEPFGEVRGDIREGIVASTVANANRDAKKRGPYFAKDFMPSFDRQEEQTPEEQLEVAAQMVVAMGGRDLRFH